MPVVEHYKRQGKLANISAVPPPDEVSTDATLSMCLLARCDTGRSVFT